MPLPAFLRSFLPEPQLQPRANPARPAIAAGLSILLTAALSAQLLSGTATPWLVLSMGASSVLLFCLPASPLAQPWPFVGGHLVSAAVGVACAQWVPQLWLACGLAVGLSVVGMVWLRCLHPPGGAVTLIMVLGGEPVRRLGFEFLWLPLGLNLLLMLGLALLLNRFLCKAPYPARRAPPNPHLRADPTPLQRLGLRQEDLQASLRAMGTTLDVSRTDLDALFRGAQMAAAERRLGEVRCRDIMSQDIASVEFGTPLDEAWRLLYTHKVNALPVLDSARHVIGIVTLVDFLKAAQLNRPDNLRQRLRAFLAPSGKTHSDKAEVVGQIMTGKVLTAGADLHIVALVSLLSDQGMHHVPIVDGGRRLCGMVTQSDLIAALFHGGERNARSQS